MGNEGSVQVFQNGEVEEDLKSSEENDIPSNYWDFFKNGYETIINTIIRPPRDLYNISNLGPEMFSLNQVDFYRQDFEVINLRGYRLQCSLWEHKVPKTTKKRCIIYLHSLSGSRIEVLPFLNYLLISGFSVAAFDFSGSGKSDGNYVSLGWHESEDIKFIGQHLYRKHHIDSLILWGRCMGANACLLYIGSIQCLIQRIEITIQDASSFKITKSQQSGHVCISQVLKPSLQELKMEDKIISINDKDVSSLASYEIEELLEGVNNKNPMKLVLENLEHIPCNGRKHHEQVSNNFFKVVETREYIESIVVDSAFCDLERVIYEMNGKGLNVPSFAISAGLALISSSIKKAAAFNIYQLKPIRSSHLCRCPVVFLHALQDDFVGPEHSRELYENYSGKKTIELFDGIHDSPRSKDIIEKVIAKLNPNYMTDNQVINIPEKCEYKEWVIQRNIRTSKKIWDEQIDTLAENINEAIDIKVLGYRRVHEQHLGTYIVYQIEVINLVGCKQSSELSSAWGKAVADTKDTAETTERCRQLTSLEVETPNVDEVEKSRKEKTKKKWMPSWQFAGRKGSIETKTLQHDRRMTELVYQSHKEPDASFNSDIYYFGHPKRCMSDTDMMVNNLKKDSVEDLKIQKLKEYSVVYPIEYVAENFKTYVIERRYHDVRIYMNKMNALAGGMGSDLHIIRSRLIYSTKFGEKRLLERKELLADLFRTIVSNPTLWKSEATREFLELPTLHIKS